jgi:hypothetical protein
MERRQARARITTSATRPIQTAQLNEAPGTCSSFPGTKPSTMAQMKDLPAKSQPMTAPARV